MPIKIIQERREEEFTERYREFDLLVCEVGGCTEAFRMCDAPPLEDRGFCAIERRRSAGVGEGFSFPVDEAGNLIGPNGEPPCEEAWQNFCKCVAGQINVIDRGVKTRSWSYWHAAVGQCLCGAEVELDGFTCTCGKCGRDYNSSGQLLADRSQWGAETGESLSDILRIR